MKKIILGLTGFATALAVIPMFAAFEAHVINVTARIENALNVPIEPISFGTVFPQEYLVRDLPVMLSQSFMDESDADDVEYIIRQKPKCGFTTDNGTQGPFGPTWTGHVVVVDPATGEVRIDCDIDMPTVDLQTLPPGATPGQLPLLCPYLSKHADGMDDDGNDNTPGAMNDSSTPAFHKPWTIGPAGEIVWTDTVGRLAKSERDTMDKWVIDLAVPCFGGYCAQDWASFVHSHNDQANPDEFTQPMSNEHKVFGCNLWVEVTGVSRVSDGTI
jgi:hypothetical protein